MDDGTYLTPFDPPFSITNRLRGEVDAALPAWVDIAFGFDAVVPHGPGTWSADTCPYAGGLDQNIYGDYTP